MRLSILVGVALAAVAFATSNDSPAATHMHPFNCKLVSSTAPYTEVSGSLSGGLFTNTTGSYKWAMCPISRESTEGDYYRIYGSPTNMACYLQTVNVAGTVTLYSHTSHVGNYWHWSLAGLDAVEMQCYAPNNGVIWTMVNY